MARRRCLNLLLAVAPCVAGNPAGSQRLGTTPCLAVTEPGTGSGFI